MRFTLLGLLVVLAVLATILGLLSFQSVRQAQPINESSF